MSSNNIYYVYMYIRAVDSINGEAGTPYYVGKGSNKRAFDKHDNVKVPKDKRRIIIVKSNMPEKSAYSLEKLLISIYGRLDIKNGCLRNLSDGGKFSVNQTKNIGRKKVSVICIDTDIIFESLKSAKKWVKENTNYKTPCILFIKRAATGKVRKAYGYKWRLVIDGEVQHINDPIKPEPRKIKCIDLDIIFKDAVEAESWLKENNRKGNKGQIQKACRGENATCGGYKWMYADAEFQPKAILVKYHPVICIETGMIFEQIKHAVEWCRLNGFPKATHASIHFATKGIKQKTAYGYTWKTLDD